MSPILGFILLPVFVLGLILILTHGTTVQVLNPLGLIALKERNLIVMAVLLLFALAIPVLIVMFFVVWKYREDNTKATYSPEWHGNWFLKSISWVILSIYVVIFGFIVWNAAHALDPYKPISSTTKPIAIQVVALQWKWLFIYPEQHIATVNFVEFPVATPVTFLLTADAPMTSFWIPSLSGQIYAMTSMQTQLHVLSDKTGDFQGKNSEINGTGYGEMEFTARAATQRDFNIWVTQLKKSSKPLNTTSFAELDKPSLNVPITYYAPVNTDLYDNIISKYMEPTGKPSVHIKESNY
ncbi:MAG: COX aromatic rich motif-containing protein [Patescibacteria group bacterium]|nr:COX aromatic rich motif-containing protein [Patescibacteria group bacterium]